MRHHPCATTTSRPAIPPSKAPGDFGISLRQKAIRRGNGAAVEAALGYFVNIIPRMQYGTFRAKNYFIGSGFVEAGCPSLIGKRCRQSGMFWGERGADKVLARCCIHASGRMDSFWKYRFNSCVAENASLPVAA